METATVWDYYGIYVLIGFIFFALIYLFRGDIIEKDFEQDRIMCTVAGIFTIVFWPAVMLFWLWLWLNDL
jgi:hypothetical protein